LREQAAARDTRISEAEPERLPDIRDELHAVVAA